MRVSTILILACSAICANAFSFDKKADNNVSEQQLDELAKMKRAPCIPGSYGLRRGNGYNGYCCRDQSDCWESCIKGKCNGPKKPTTTKKTTTKKTTTKKTTTTKAGSCIPGSYGLRRGNGYNGYCCRDQSDCWESCIKGKCNGPKKPTTTKKTTTSTKSSSTTTATPTSTTATTTTTTTTTTATTTTTTTAPPAPTTGCAKAGLTDNVPNFTLEAGSKIALSLASDACPEGSLYAGFFYDMYLGSYHMYCYDHFSFVPATVEDFACISFLDVIYGQVNSLTVNMRGTEYIYKIESEVH